LQKVLTGETQQETEQKYGEEKEVSVLDVVIAMEKMTYEKDEISIEMMKAGGSEGYQWF
jgi:hypothetical protein